MCCFPELRNYGNSYTTKLNETEFFAGGYGKVFKIKRRLDKNE
jgi:hypothetical protein